MATLLVESGWVRRGVQRVREWFREARARRVFRVQLCAPDHVRRDMGRFSAFSVGGTHVRVHGCAAAGGSSNARCFCDCSATCAPGAGTGAGGDCASGECAGGGDCASGAGAGGDCASGGCECTIARRDAAGCTDGALAGAMGRRRVFRTDRGAAERTCLALECDDDSDRIVHLRRLWAAFPALRDCAFEMTRVTGAWREKCAALF